MLQCFDNFHTQQRIRQCLHDSGFKTREVGVINRDSRLVGYGVLGFSGDVGQLWNLGVSAESRRKGIGSYITEDRIRFARDMGLATVTTKISAETPLSAYQKMGFVPAENGWIAMALR